MKRLVFFAILSTCLVGMNSYGAESTGRVPKASAPSPLAGMTAHNCSQSGTAQTGVRTARSRRPSPSVPTTTVCVYRVADLVAYDTVRQGPPFGVCTMEEWQSEHKQTLDALEGLGDLLQTTFAADSASFATHAESLSLIIRHTSEGHGEIADLLEQLRQNDESQIELSFLAILELATLEDPVSSRVSSTLATMGPQPPNQSSYPGDYQGGNQTPSQQSVTGVQPHKSDAYYPGRNQTPLHALPEDERSRVRELCGKWLLTPDEAEEVYKIYSKYFKHPLPTYTVRVANGRKTKWGLPDLPCTVAALVSSDLSHVHLRVDNIADDVSEKISFAVQCVSIPDRHSVRMPTYCDGGTTLWLVTAKVIVPNSNAEVGSTSSHESSNSASR